MGRAATSSVKENKVEWEQSAASYLFCKPLNTHLSLLDRHRLASGRCLLVDAGQKVLGDPQGILQERVVQVAGGRVFEQVLQIQYRKYYLPKASMLR